MSKSLYRVISVMICISLMLGMTGCARKNQSAAKGTYVEREISLPEGANSIYDIQGGKGDSILMFAAVDDSDCILWETSDNGESWEEKITMPKGMEKSVIFCGLIKKDGTLVCGMYESILDKAGQEVELLKEPKVYGTVDKEGNFDELAVDIKDDSILSGIYAYGDRIFGCDINGYYYELTEENTRCLNPGAETAGTPYDFIIVNDTLLGMSGEHFEQYDINTGKASDIYHSFSEFCMNKMREDGGMPIFHTDDEDKLYYLGESGLFRYDESEKKEEKILDGEQYQFSRTDTVQQELRTMSENGYVLLSFEGSGPVIRTYTFDPNARIEEQKELTIYALQNNSSLQTVIDGFREKYPNIRVHTEKGLDESMGLTLEDAVRSLNVSLFGEDGPDVLVLDGLPIEAYIKQKKLLDLTKDISEQSLVDQVAGTYDRDRKIYAIPLGFSLLDIHVTKQVLEKGTGLKEISEQIAELYNKKKIVSVDLWEEGSVFSSLFYYYFPECLKDDQVDREKLEQFYLSLEKIFCNSEYNWTVEVEGEVVCNLTNIVPDNMQQGDMMMHIGETQLMAGKLQNLADIQLAYLVKHENPDIRCNYFDDILQKQYFTEASLGIPSNAKNSAEAKLFIEYAVSEEGQKRIEELGESFPVNEQVFDRMFESEKAANYRYTIENRNGKNVTLDATGIKTDDYKEWKKEIKDYKTPVYQDTVIREIVLNMAMDYINGEEELQDAVNKCVQGVELYLNE